MASLISTDVYDAGTNKQLFDIQAAQKYRCHRFTAPFENSFLHVTPLYWSLHDEYDLDIIYDPLKNG